MRSCKPSVDRTPVHAVVTNSTYDGLCYNIERVEALLGKSVDRLHFDEAWYGYARFNPIYAKRFAMHGEPGEPRADRPTLFATQSTHKLLAALSQASYIHVRDGRRPIDHARFNQAFMMHASTSPQYAIIASNDIAAAMMDGPSGEALTGESIREAVAFRQTLARLNAEFKAKGGWFFNAWQPDTVADGKSRKKTPFHLADPERLARDPSALGAAPRRVVARLRRPRGRVLHAGPDQGVGRHARHGTRRQAGRPRAFRPRCSPPISMRRASSWRRPRTSRACSCSRWA